MLIHDIFIPESGNVVALHRFHPWAIGQWTLWSQVASMQCDNWNIKLT